MITWPLMPWIPDEGHFPFVVAANILEVAGGVLDHYGEGQDYEIRKVYHGASPAPVAKDYPQLSVALSSLNVGNAGQEQFGWAAGDLGKFGQRVLSYQVEVVNVWPVIDGGITAELAQAQEAMSAADKLYTHGFLIYNALLSLSLGGPGSVKTDMPISLIDQDQMLVGKAVPMEPKGGMAGWLIPFFVQF